MPVHIMKIRFIPDLVAAGFLRLSGRKFLFSCLPGKWKGKEKMLGKKSPAVNTRSPRITGICGAGRSVGTTHLAVWSANYLASCCQKKDSGGGVEFP